MEISEDLEQEESLFSQEDELSMISEEDTSIHSANVSNGEDTECEKCSTPSTVFCEQCVCFYCDQCSTLRHKHPKRHGHDIKAINQNRNNNCK